MPKPNKLGARIGSKTYAPHERTYVSTTKKKKMWQLMGFKSKKSYQVMLRKIHLLIWKDKHERKNPESI